MTQVLGDATINELEGGLAGSLVRPGDGEYEEARHIWNGAIDKHPAMIVRPAGTDDVVRTVRFAASEGLPVAVRGGGAQRRRLLHLRRWHRRRPVGDDDR